MKQKPEVWKKSAAKAIVRKRAILAEAKAVPCMDCGNTFPSCCMDFDHRPNETKLFSIGQSIKTYSDTIIRAEIAKCDIVCACCHRIRTQLRLGLSL